MIFSSSPLRTTIFSGMIAGCVLTTSVAIAQSTPLGAPSSAASPGEPVTVAPGGGYEASYFNAGIDSTSLDAPSIEAAGLAGAGSLGLSQDMWGKTTGPEAIKLVSEAEPTRLYTVNRLIRRTLVAGATPPENSDGLLARRAGALIRFGAAEEASSLAGAAGTQIDTELRRTRAEAALIVGRDEVLCGKDILDPETALPEDDDGFWPALRGYCLALTGDPLASVAINAMRELGSVDPIDAPMLEALVDKSLIDFVAVPHASALTPLRIAMLRSMGRANHQIVDSAPLPMIAGLFALESTGSTSALIAAERLEAVGAIETKTLREFYLSLADEVNDGPVARRAAAVVDAEKKPDAGKIGEALIAAARADGSGGFAQMARALAPAAAKLAPSAASGLGARGYAVRDAMLLGGFVREAGTWSDAQGTKSLVEQADVAAVMAVADADWPGRWRREFGDALRERAKNNDEHARRSLAALAGFDIALRPNLAEEGYLKAAAEGKTAETVLSASAAIGKDDTVRARTLDTAIRAMRRVGLSDDARRIATEIMITERWR